MDLTLLRPRLAASGQHWTAKEFVEDSTDFWKSRPGQNYTSRRHPASLAGTDWEGNSSIKSEGNLCWSQMPAKSNQRCFFTWLCAQDL